MNRINLQCNEHPKRIISHICLQKRCSQNPLICEQCMTTFHYKKCHSYHQHQIKHLHTGIEQLSIIIQEYKKPLTILYQDLINQKNNQALMKWQSQKQHLLAIQNHLNTVKYQIEQEINIIIQKFNQEIQHYKKQIYAELDNYYEIYKDKFNKYSKAIDPIVLMSDIYKYYGNKKSIYMKLLLKQNNCTNWLINLKNTLKYAERIAIDLPLARQQINRLSINTNQLINQLPHIRNLQYEQQLPNILENTMQQIFNSLVYLEGRKNHVARSNSMNTLSVTPSIYWKNSNA